MAQVTGRLGAWETLIGGVLLIVTAVLNPDGIAGGFRRRAVTWHAADRALSRDGAA
jgi:hypothetical protein